MTYDEQLFDVPLELNKPRIVDLQGTRASTLVGPAEFPRQVRLELKAGSGVIAIDLIYYVDPGEQRIRLDADAGQPTLFVGRFSGRIMRMELPVASDARAGRVRMGVELARLSPLFAKLAQSHDPLSRSTRKQANVEAVTDLVPWIDGKLEELRRSQSRESQP